MKQFHTKRPENSGNCACFPPAHEPPLSRPSATLSPPCGERAGRGVPIWFMASIHVRILEVFPPLTLPTPSSWGEGNISGPLMVAVFELRLPLVANPCSCFPVKRVHTRGIAYESLQAFPALDFVRFAVLPLPVRRLRGRAPKKNRARRRSDHRPSERSARIRKKRHPAQASARHLARPAEQ